MGTDTHRERRDLLPFLALEAATLISGIGNGVSIIALPWLTLELTDDPAAAGVVVAAGALPTLFSSLASGVIIDRLGRQRTSVGSDVFSAVSAAMIPVFGLLGVLSFPLVVVASAIGAAFDPVGVTARESMLPDVARRARLLLERVNGVHEAVWGLAFLIGPGVAGLLIGAVGAGNAFWAMFAGFAASAILVASARMPPPPRPETGRRWLADAIDGMRFVLREPAIRATTVTSTIAFTFGYSVVGVVLPVVFERLDRPEALGALFVAFSGGGVAGALAYGAFGERVSRRAAFSVGLAAMVAVAALFVVAPPYWVQIAAMAVAGFLTGAVNPIFNVILQERAPEEMRGRALSTTFAFAYAVYPIGYVSAGLLINAIGVTWTLVVFAVASALVTLWAILTPALRDMGARRGGTT